MGEENEFEDIWSINLEGDICSIYLYGVLYVKEYNTWHHVDSIGRNLGYNGNSTNCDYSASQVSLSKFNENSQAWESNIDSLDQGNNQLRFDVGDLNLMENASYYISASINAQGSSSYSFSQYFDIGETDYDSSSSSNDYNGEDIYFNFSVSDWTCVVSYNVNIYLITPASGWQNLLDSQTSYLSLPSCNPAGDFSLSGVLDGEWNENLESTNFDLPVGQVDLYWNMTDLNIGERYELYFLSLIHI